MIVSTNEDWRDSHLLVMQLHMGRWFILVPFKAAGQSVFMTCLGTFLNVFQIQAKF